MIVISHIAKTGGMSFRHYLQQTFGSRLYMDYVGMGTAALPWWRRLAVRVLGSNRGIPWWTQCIMGHIGPQKYDKLFPQARHAVWLRDPVQRIVSYYHYLRRATDGKHPVRRLLVEDNLSLADFAQLPYMRNGQCYVLQGKPVGAFDFVGLTEDFDQGVALFARIFGCPAPQGRATVNANPERQGREYALDETVRAIIRENNRDDEVLYRQGVERYQALCREHGFVTAASRQRAA